MFRYFQEKDYDFSYLNFFFLKCKSSLLRVYAEEVHKSTEKIIILCFLYLTVKTKAHN